MVSRLFLFKMLHCKSLKRSRSDRERSRNPPLSENTSGDTVTIKVERDYVDPEVETSANYFDGNLTCRVCLKEGTIPIFGDDFCQDISEALISFGNIEITLDDTYPKHLCTACHSLLQGAMLFRKTAQQSEQLLKKPKKEEVFSNSGPEEEDDTVNDFEDPCYDYKEAEPEEKVKKKKEKLYHCSKCGVDFKTLKEIKTHRRTANHKNMKYQCPICNKVYNMPYYKRHLLYHKNETPYVCDVCGKAFIMQGHFSRHRLTHDYELPFQCQLCPYRGRFSESLKMHMRRHTGEKPYQCPECPVRCINKSNLSRHMNTHKKDHDFKCDLCGRGYFTKRELDLHFKVDHTGIKDHVCNICGKAFGYRKQMMKHQLKVHKREKLQSGRTPLYLQIARHKQQEEVV